MPSFEGLPGFRDFYPADLAVRTHIMNAWRETARRHGYEEYDGPPLEPLELYTEKSGDEIVRQLYNFVDKGERAVALRPEMTPTFARMVGARAASMRKPIRWFSIPQLFRYERTQRGRLREHFQWNVDLVGETDIGADAEVLSVALSALRLLGLTSADIVARVNDRRLLEKLLLKAGVRPEYLVAAYNVIDKLGRESDQESRRRFHAEAMLDDAATERVMRIVDTPGLEALLEEFGGDAELRADIDRLRGYHAQLSDLGFGDFVRFDPRIVRGLAYYTGIVFEIFDRQGELRAVCGGGRYDSLLKQVSNVDLPALGFGMGDVVLGELLKDRGLLPDTAPHIDCYIVAVTEAEKPLQRRLARALRDSGHSATYAFTAGGVGKQFKDANARGARRVIVIGPDEVEQGMAAVKNMESGTESRVPLERLLDGHLE